MNWESKVEEQMAKIDDKMEVMTQKVEQTVDETIDKGIELSEKPSVEIPTAVVNIAAGSALTFLGKKSLSKKNTVVENVIAGSAIAIGATAVVASSFKLVANVFKLKKEHEQSALEKKIRKEIEDAK